MLFNVQGKFYNTGHISWVKFDDEKKVFTFKPGDEKEQSINVLEEDWETFKVRATAVLVCKDPFANFTLGGKAKKQANKPKAVKEETAGADEAKPST